MGITRNMGGHRQPVADTMALGLSEDGLVARARRVVATHIVPEKTGPAALAHPVYRIRWPQSVLIEPIGPFLRIIVNSHALLGRGEKIQMVTERKPGAAHESAGLTKQIGKLGSGLCTREFKLEGVGGVDRRHYEPWRLSLIPISEPTSPY